MKKVRREHVLAAVLAAVPIAAWFFVFQPRNTDINTIRAATDAMQTTLTRLKELGREVGDITIAVEKAQTNLEQFRENIPDAEEVDDLLGEIDAIAIRHSLEVASVRTLAQVDAPEYSELPISLRIEGTFLGTYGFLSDIERLPRVTRIRDLELKRDRVRAGNGEENGDVIQLDLTLIIYFNHESNRTSELVSRSGA